MKLLDGNERYGDLIRRLNRGDEAAFAQLYELYYVSFCLYANRMLYDPAAAEDVVVEVYLKAWEARRTFKSSDHFRAYLYKGIKNACLDIIKLRKRARAREESFAEATAEQIENDYLTNIVRTEIEQALHQAIRQLPSQVSAVIEKAYMDGKSNLEISEEMGISLQTVKNHKYRGLGFLRKRLGKDWIAVISLGLLPFFVR